MFCNFRFYLCYYRLDLKHWDGDVVTCYKEWKLSLLILFMAFTPATSSMPDLAYSRHSTMASFKINQYICKRPQIDFRTIVWIPNVMLLFCLEKRLAFNVLPYKWEGTEMYWEKKCVVEEKNQCLVFVPGSWHRAPRSLGMSWIRMSFVSQRDDSSERWAKIVPGWGLVTRKTNYVIRRSEPSAPTFF